MSSPHMITCELCELWGNLHCIMFSNMVIALGIYRTKMNCDYVKGVGNLAILYKWLLKSLDLIHVFHMHWGYPTWKWKGVWIHQTRPRSTPKIKMQFTQAQSCKFLSTLSGIYLTQFYIQCRCCTLLLVKGLLSFHS